MEQPILDGYVRWEEELLVRLDALLRDPPLLLKKCGTVARRRGRRPAEKLSPTDASVTEDFFLHRFRAPTAAAFLVLHGIVVVEGGEVRVNAEAADTLRALLMFLMARVPNRVKAAKRLVRIEREAREGLFASVTPDTVSETTSVSVMNEVS